jgi:hypothetical protein
MRRHVTSETYSHIRDSKSHRELAITPIEEYLQNNDLMKSMLEESGPASLQHARETEQDIYEEESQFEKEDRSHLEKEKGSDSSSEKRTRGRKYHQDMVVDELEEEPYRQYYMVDSDESEDESEHTRGGFTPSSTSSLGSSFPSLAIPLSLIPPPPSLSSFDKAFQSVQSRESSSTILSPSFSFTNSCSPPSTLFPPHHPSVQSPFPSTQTLTQLIEPDAPPHELEREDQSHQSDSRAKDLVRTLKQMRSFQTLEPFMNSGLALLLQQRLYDPSAIISKSVMLGFQQWMNGIEPDDGPVSLKTSHYGYWKNLLHRGDQWADLGQIVVRLFSTSASEAECEREISRMKQLVGSHRWGLSSSSLHALMQMISHFSKKE